MICARNEQKDPRKPELPDLSYKDIASLLKLNGALLSKHRRWGQHLRISMCVQPLSTFQKNNYLTFVIYDIIQYVKMFMIAECWYCKCNNMYF